jgi:RNA polymerase sigma-70 factor (ECF subfamily)
MNQFALHDWQRRIGAGTDRLAGTRMFDMARRTHMENEQAGQSSFATTQWSMVLAAGRRSSPDADQALATLCETYWYPLYAYARRRVTQIGEAQDLTQSFFATLLEKDYVRPAAPERGRFRSYLLTAFQHFLSKEWEKAKAQKRGGGKLPIRLDFSDSDSRWHSEPYTHLTADQLFERQWAVAVLHRVMDRLAAEVAQDGKAKQFELLKGFLIGEPEEHTYSDIAKELGTTAAAVKMVASRMRRRYRRLLRDEIAQTVASQDDVDQEIRDLFNTLGR